ncbi:hypothetical protein [Streptomyces tendae]|uniref:hypothetical protein n=1 Tax=Streptomyces tendae TaxID=1932 RepID=UPI003811FA91
MTTTQNTSETSTTTDRTEWHWVMTVQTSDGITNTRSATLLVPTGTTRAQTLAYIYDQFKADYDGPLTVLFFDLQPNRL